jgi:3',5'-nucleoside bisphosphate phosphatase
LNYADLHLHTTASDGTLSPSAIVARAKEQGFSAIAITDHDTTAGLEEALAAGEKLNIEVIPGIELSTLEGNREIHLLGYYLDPENAELQLMLEKMIATRQNRSALMVEKLNSLGYNITISRVYEIAGTEFIGRPHIARALLEKGFIDGISEAFTEDFIGRGGRAYIERFKLTPSEGIAILLKAKAIPVLAHPGFLGQGPPLLEDEILLLINIGLYGIEVYYSKHTPDQEEYYKQLAQKHNLLITGGSDCHGYSDATNCLGSIKLPYSNVVALKNARNN